MPTIKKIGVLTGGGDAPGLNAVIRAVVKTANSRKEEIRADAARLFGEAFEEAYPPLFRRAYLPIGFCEDVLRWIERRHNRLPQPTTAEFLDTTEKSNLFSAHFVDGYWWIVP